MNRSKLIIALIFSLLFSLQLWGVASADTPLVVDRTDDDASASACTTAPNDCSLRGAITNANNNAGADTITLPAGTYTLSIAGSREAANATGDLNIISNGPLTINGAGAGSTVINGGAIDRVLEIRFVTVELNDLTITNGYTENTYSGAGISTAFGAILTLNNCIVSDNHSTIYSGGGIEYNGADMTLNNTTVTGNTTGYTGGGIAVAYFLEATLTLNNSTVSNNTAAYDGGGIADHGSGALILNNSTVSGNSAKRHGGGIGIGFGEWGDPTANINFSTITNNTADSDSNGGDGGGIYITNPEDPFEGAGGTSTITFANSLVAGNTDNTTAANNDCYKNDGVLNSQGYNIIGNNDGCGVTAGTGDNFGTTASPVGAKLLALADNGGPTWTHALDNGSAALEQIPSGTNGCGTTYTTDQRGEPRPYDTSCEIGAWEGTPPTTGPQLALTKSVNPSSAKPGEAITYTISFSNTGVDTATNVVITDELSVHISNANYTNSGVALTPVGGAHYAWTAPDLLQNDGGVITITGILTKPLAAGVFTNTVTMAVSGTVKTASAPLMVENVVPVADAGADQSVAISTTVTLDGRGSSDINGDTLTYAWAQTGGPTVALSSATVVTPTFTAPAAAAVLTFTLTVDDGGVSSTPDEIVITVSEKALEADLALSKTLQTTFVTSGTFTIQVENLGPDAADSAVVSDTLSAKVVNVTWNCVAAGSAVCGAPTGTGDLMDTLGAFPVGGVVTYTLSGTLTEWSMVTNTAEVTAPAGVIDPVLGNNRATVTRYMIIFPTIFNEAIMH